jgi:hypothetical protein
MLRRQCLRDCGLRRVGRRGPLLGALRAALHLQLGERADAARLVRRAVKDAMHESGATLLALAAERSLALVGGDSRSRSLAAVVADLLVGGAKNPARWADLFLPGFATTPDQVGTAWLRTNCSNTSKCTGCRIVTSVSILRARVQSTPEIRDTPMRLILAVFANSSI